MAALEVFPSELIELIMTSLELGDITSLRLTCRRIEDKTSQQFGNAFRYKDVKLTTTALQKFVRITGQGRFGCLLRKCTLTGIVSDEEITTDDVPEHGRLLTDAFRNLRHRSPSGGLDSLTLGLAGRVGGELVLPDDIRVRHGWRAIWDAAARTFRTTITALVESQVSVGEHLDIFSTVTGCSLACDVFIASAGIFASAQVFGSLRKLELSLSAPYRAARKLSEEEKSVQHTPDTIRRQQSRYSCQVFRAIIQSWHAILELGGLDLHWYDLGREMSTTTLPDTSLESSIGAGSRTSLHIQSCRLRGVFISETDLLHLLQTIRPEALILTDIHLNTGIYTPILDYMNDQDSSIKSYHLDDLYQGTPLIHFEIPGSSKFTYIRGIVGPSTLIRQASDAKEAVRYRLPPGRPKGSGQVMRWRQAKRLEFGPPVGNGFADIDARE